MGLIVTAISVTTTVQITSSRRMLFIGVASRQIGSCRAPTVTPRLDRRNVHREHATIGTWLHRCAPSHSCARSATVFKRENRLWLPDDVFPQDREEGRARIDQRYCFRNFSISSKN